VDRSLPEHPSDLREYLRVIRTRKWTIIVVTIAVVGAALFLSFRQTPQYEAETQVFVEAISADPSVPAQPPNLDTERQLVSTAAVATKAADILGTNVSPSDLVEDLSVSVVTNTEILKISFADPDPEFARAAADAFADAYLQFRQEKGSDEIQAELEALQSELEVTREELTALAQRIDAASEPDERADLETDAITLEAQVNVLVQRREALKHSLEVLSGGQIVEPAEVPTSPASPDHIQTGILALVVGLALGTALAFVRERLDDSIRSRHELERRLGRPVLAMVPYVPGWRKRDEPHLITVEDPKNPVSEAYRTLRTNVQFLASSRDMRTVLVTSALAGDGKTATAANLAVVLAQAGRRVVLVSADLRRPRLHRFMKVANETGLSLALSDSIPFWEAALECGIDNLRVIPSGPIPPNPAELLGGDRMAEILDQLRLTADLVVMDSPPVLAVADASILAPLVDATLFVVDAQTGSRAATSQARDQLEHAGARLLGAVMNRFDPSQAGDYPYSFYYYHYAHADGADKEGVALNGERARGRRRRKRRSSAGSMESAGSEG
jgi:tyrosine-protein kinase